MKGNRPLGRTKGIPVSMVGAAGVHFVVSELSLRGLIVLPTIRNTPGIDIVVASPDGRRHTNLQVKTSMRNVTFWPVGERYRKFAGASSSYVFLRYLKREKGFEAFLVPTERVLKEVEENERKKKAKGSKKWTPCWHLPKDKEEQQKLRQNWIEFGKLRAESG